MKAWKILLIGALACLLLFAVLVSCGDDDDESKHGYVDVDAPDKRTY